MTTAKSTDQGIWKTFVESPPAVKAVLAGVFVNKVGGFLNIFLVLFLTSQGYSAGQAATALGVYGVGNVVGVLVGGALADRLGARNSTVLSMGGAALLTAALVVWSLTMLVSGAAVSYPMLLLSRLALGVVASVVVPVKPTGDQWPPLSRRVTRRTKSCTSTSTAAATSTITSDGAHSKSAAVIGGIAAAKSPTRARAAPVSRHRMAKPGLPWWT